jgi:SAM-dependent methyltransferase
MSEFPAGFFDRADETPDSVFYTFDRLVTHIDPGAIAAVRDLYRELALTGDVLDICSSWISHFDPVPARLVALGMNANELDANAAATDTIIHDLNAEPVLPFDDGSFDAVTCCVSVDYLTRPTEVFADVARVLRPGGAFVVTFSNRCFPTKAIRAWLAASDRQRCSIVATYFALTDGFGPATVQLRNPGAAGDPLYAVWARRLPLGVRVRRATATDQAFISEMQYEALFVPNGGDRPDRSLLEVPEVARYHVGFGSRAGDLGFVAEDGDGRPIGAVWVRQVEGYGFVDDHTPELAIGVVADRRGNGMGGLLLEALLAVLPRVSLSVDRRNPAIRLYGRFGFEEVRAVGDHTVVMLHDEVRP